MIDDELERLYEENRRRAEALRDRIIARRERPPRSLLGYPIIFKDQLLVPWRKPKFDGPRDESLDCAEHLPEESHANDDRDLGFGTRLSGG